MFLQEAKRWESSRDQEEHVTDFEPSPDSPPTNVDHIDIEHDTPEETSPPMCTNHESDADAGRVLL